MTKRRRCRGSLERKEVDVKVMEKIVEVLLEYQLQDKTI